MTDDMLTVEQAAKALQVSTKTIRRRIEDGTLKAERFGPRLLRIPAWQINQAAAVRQEAQQADDIALEWDVTVMPWNGSDNWEEVNYHAVGVEASDAGQLTLFRSGAPFGTEEGHPGTFSTVRTIRRFQLQPFPWFEDPDIRFKGTDEVGQLHLIFIRPAALSNLAVQLETALKLD